jgi:uncharacterized protein YbjT (DUF2867 family)
LVPELLAAGHQVRVLARHPDRLVDRAWFDQVAIVSGDALDPVVLSSALADVDAAYYLMHSLVGGRDFHNLERRMASLFATAAADAQVGRIVYLGALAPMVPRSELTEHLRSRIEVGEALRGSGVPTVELRAAVIIGSGSASFEMLRHLTERLPFMVTPRWVRTPTQPIAIRDVLRYLVAALDMPEDTNRYFEIGGPDVTTYEGMIACYARVAGLRPRRLLRVPVLTPSLSSHWVGAVTPVPASLARPLVDSLAMETVCHERDITELVPDPIEGLMPLDRAVALAIRRSSDGDVITSWSESSVPGAPSDPLPSDPDWTGGTLYTDERSTRVNAPPDVLWQVIEGLGGGRGYYSFPLGWEVRGWLDRMVGGVGLQRGRRDPDRLRVGDPLDFWRVEARIPSELLRLRAEMRLPGRAWLELHVRPDPDRSDGLGSLYTQRAVFWPRGLLGRVYWTGMLPFHHRIFGPMLNNIRDTAEQRQAELCEGLGTTMTRPAK